MPVLPILIEDPDAETSELLSTIDTKYTRTSQERLADAVRLTLRDEIRRGFHKPALFGGAGPPPSPPRDFSGRSGDVEAVRRLFAKGHRAVVISGLPGVGKSALASAVAADMDLEPALHLDLRTAPRPAPLGESLMQLLAGLGHRPGDLPAARGQRRELWRSATRERAILLVVDDVAQEQEVRELLPDGDSVALITARHELPALEARAYALDVLPESDAVGFLAAVLGEQRVDQESDAAARLCGLCGGLPLALRLTAARLTTRPNWTLADYAEWLENERTRLEGMAVGDLDVRASFSLSYSLLSESEARAFRAAGLLGGPTFDADAISAALEVNADAALESVADAQLLSVVAWQTYEIHDLLRLYARERLEGEESQGEHTAMLLRLGAHLGSKASGRAAAVHGPAEWDEPPLSWIAREAENVKAVCDGLARCEEWQDVSDLVSAVGPLCGTAHAWGYWGSLLDFADRSATELGDPGLVARVAINRGIVAAFSGDPESAGELLRSAGRAAEEIGDRALQARATAQQGTLLKEAGDPQAATVLTSRALELYRETGDAQGEARALGDLANQLDDLGRSEEAIDRHREALAVFERIGDRYGQALEHGNIAIALQRTGQLQAADAELRIAEDTFVELGALVNLAETRRRRGEIQLTLGNAADALPLLDAAVEELEEIGMPVDLARALAPRGGARRALDEPGGEEDARRACTILEQVGAEYEWAIQAIAIAYFEPPPGIEHRQVLAQALEVLRRHPDRPSPQQVGAAEALSLFALMEGRSSESMELLEEAAATARMLPDKERLAKLLIGVARRRGEVGERSGAQAALEEAQRLGVTLDHEAVSLAQRLAESCVTIIGEPDDDQRMRIERAVRLALERLDWIVSAVEVRVGELPGGPGRSGATINADRILISPDFLPRPGDREPALLFSLHKLVAQHILMGMGVASDGGKGSICIEMIGAWFPRVALEGLFGETYLPLPPATDDEPRAHRFGALLGAAIAGDADAEAELEAVGDVSDAAIDLQVARAEWEAERPAVVITCIAESCRAC